MWVTGKVVMVVRFCPHVLSASSEAESVLKALPTVFFQVNWRGSNLTSPMGKLRLSNLPKVQRGEVRIYT